jgi:hypothetical protein
MFAQSENDSWKKIIKCHNCGKKGHLVQECCSKSSKIGDGAKNKDQRHANVEGDVDEDEGDNIFVQNKKLVVNQNYLLLDIPSTLNQIANASLLKNIRKLIIQLLCIVMQEQQNQPGP